MTEIIYIILGVAIIVLSGVYLIFNIIVKNDNNVGVIKTRIVFPSILLAVSIIKMIMALILGESTIVSDLICVILWGILIVIGCRYLKNAKRTVNDDSHIMPNGKEDKDNN